MKNDPILDSLISEEWPNLKKRTENETDVEKLIAAVREIDEFLLHLEQRVHRQRQVQAKREYSPRVRDIRAGR